MKNVVFIIVYLVIMIGLIVGVDVLFLRDHFWWRLGVNIGIVALFAATYVAYFRHVFG